VRTFTLPRGLIVAARTHDDDHQHNGQQGCAYQNYRHMRRRLG
jgi:hypothetical protein